MTRPQGWYAANRPGHMRYWDGRSWTVSLWPIPDSGIPPRTDRGATRQPLPGAGLGMTPTRWATAVMVSGITALVLVCLGMWQGIYGYPVPAWGWLSLGIGVALSIYTPMTARRVKREMWASGVCSREGMVWLGVVCSWIAIGVLIVIYGGAALAGSFQDVS